MARIEQAIEFKHRFEMSESLNVFLSGMIAARYQAGSKGEVNE